MPDVDLLCKQLGYSFSNPKLLQSALTHRSAGVDNNERLEYLGDAALNFFVAAELFMRHPKAQEGDLSRLRASLVNGITLAAIARTFDLGNFLRLGPGELKSGGHRRESILAGAFEAVIGAMYLDRGFEACCQILLSIYAKRFAEVSPETALKDPKTRLQEHLQARRQPLPAYRVVEVAGEEHAQVFVVECVVPGIPAHTVGQGSSRRIAEQNAAAKALTFLSEEFLRARAHG